MSGDAAVAAGPNGGVQGVTSSATHMLAPMLCRVHTRCRSVDRSCGPLKVSAHSVNNARSASTSDALSKLARRYTM